MVENICFIVDVVIFSILIFCIANNVITAVKEVKLARIKNELEIYRIQQFGFVGSIDNNNSILAEELDNFEEEPKAKGKKTKDD